MTNETDPREEIVARAICLWVCGEDDVDSAKAFTDANWHLDIPEARAILAALDAARPAITIIDDDPGPISQEAFAYATRPAEPLPEYDATDAIDRVIANWSTISDEPPVDAEVAGLVERLHDEGARGARDSRAAAATIERQQAEIARLTRDKTKVFCALLTTGVCDQPARATAAEAEVADLRAKLAKAVEALEALVDRNVVYDGGVIRIDCEQHGNAIGVMARARTALDAIKEDRT